MVTDSKRATVLVAVVALVVGTGWSAVAKPGTGGKPAKPTTVQLSESSLSVAEGGRGSLNIKRQGDISCATTVSWGTTEGSTEEGDASITPASPLVFAAGDRGPKTLVVQAAQDADGDNESFILAITGTVAGPSCPPVTLQAPTSAVVTLVDDGVVLDADGDGVPDATDLCPGSPSTETPDADGCTPSQRAAMDDDGDGVANGADLCPGSLSTETPDADGCTPSQRAAMDDDRDGVTNGADLCPESPTNETPNSDGCTPSQLPPADADSDGEPDATDLCPGSTSTAVDGDGCTPAQRAASTTLDDDGDNVPNAGDYCPGTTVTQGVDTEGCTREQRAASTTLDDDSDGIANAYDNCPQISNPGQGDADRDGLGDNCDFGPTGAFVVRPGERVTFTDIGLSSCDSLSAFYVVDGEPQRVSWTNDPSGVEGCAGSVSPPDGDGWVNTTQLSQVITLVLADLDCLDSNSQAALYFSDGTGNADHASVSGGNPWTVRIMDAGGPPVDGSCSRTSRHVEPPSNGADNFHATVTIGSSSS